ncbi:MAG: glycosyltransferase, partial [Patescibacteria group bacterium]|nr:glycosyltransferase [Patescibacteria group bacterium]
KKIVDLIRKIKPDVIKAYNPLIQGWLAVQAGRELDIPVVISLMADYDRDLRHFAKKNRDVVNYMKLLYTKIIIEPFVIKNADEVIIVYEFLREYANKMGAKHTSLIYNRVDLSQFSGKSEPPFEKSKPVVLCVGRLRKDNKNQECLIKAIKDLDVHLVLVGDGPEYQEYKDLAKTLGIQNKVRFERSVPHKDIQKYYFVADVYAYAPKMGGIAIPVFEAAASGLPVIHSRQTFDNDPELLKDFTMLVDNNPDSFRDAISKILSDEQLRTKMIKNGFDIVKNVSGDVVEEQEKKLYERLLIKKS